MNILPAISLKPTVAQYTCCKKEKNILFDNRNVSPVSFCPSFYGFQTEYSYRPVSSKRPYLGLLNCNYENLDEFSKLYSDKINSQLMTIDKSDVEALIQRIKIKTGAHESTIKEVLYNLTLFSSYKSLDFFESLCGDYSTDLFGINPLVNSFGFDDSSLNCALQYLSHHKKFFKEGRQEKSILILDNQLLDKLQQMKSDSEFFADLKSEIESGNVVVVSLPGWNVKCMDGKYRGANFLLGSGFLECIAIDVIKRLSAGETLDEILYGDLETRFNEIMEFNTNTIRVSPDRKNAPITTNDVLENLSGPKMSETTVKKVLEQSLPKFLDESEREVCVKALCKFLDKYSLVYSSDSFAQDLTDMFKMINTKFKKPNKEIVYCIANKANSQGYFCSLFAALNQISPLNIACCQEKNSWSFLPYIQNKIPVFLDDNSITGASIVDFESLFDNQEKVIETNWVVLAATQAAAQRLNSQDGIDDFIPSSFTFYRELHSLNDFGTNTDTNFLSSQEKEMLRRIFNLGYDSSGAMCAFAHMIPDNCIDIAAGLFNNLLFRSNYETNKPLANYEDRINLPFNFI